MKWFELQRKLLSGLNFSPILGMTGSTIMVGECAPLPFPLGFLFLVSPVSLLVYMGQC